jgi:hypothetical protein
MVVVLLEVIGGWGVVVVIWCVGWVCGMIGWDVVGILLGWPMSVGNVRVKVVLAEVGVRMAFGDWIGVLVGWIWVEVVSILLGLWDMLVGVSTGGVDCGRVEVEIGLVDMVDGESDGVLVNRLFSNSGSDRMSKRCSPSNSN